MKIIDKTNPQILDEIAAENIPLGQVFRANISGYNGIFMRAFGTIVGLDTIPPHIWFGRGREASVKHSILSSPASTTYTIQFPKILDYEPLSATLIIEKQ